MKVCLSFYELISDKEMGDGTTINSYEKLLLIKEQGGFMFFETINNPDKKVFWANSKEVRFVNYLEEDWSEQKKIERKKYIDGNFL